MDVAYRSWPDVGHLELVTAAWFRQRGLLTDARRYLAQAKGRRHHRVGRLP